MLHGKEIFIRPIDFRVTKDMFAAGVVTVHVANWSRGPL